MLIFFSINLVKLRQVWLRTKQNALYLRTEGVSRKLASHSHFTKEVLKKQQKITFKHW